MQRESLQAPPMIALQSRPVVFDDEQLVLAAQEDPAEFQALYERWAVPVYQYFYHRCGEEPAAEDLTSQLFLAVYQALPRYQHRGHFPAWLFTIAANLAKANYRKYRREVPLDQALNLISRSDPSEQVTRIEEVTSLVRLVQALPQKEQELIRLRYVAELSFADMAVALHKREDAVKKSLYRLQARLQTLLEQIHD